MRTSGQSGQTAYLPKVHNIFQYAIVAVPATERDLEFIQPRLECIRRNGQCQESRFQAPTGAVVVQMEDGANRDLVADDIPPIVIDTSVKAIKLNGQLVCYVPHALVHNTSCAA